jgi:hypothetical protein
VILRIERRQHKRPRPALRHKDADMLAQLEVIREELRRLG